MSLSRTQATGICAAGLEQTVSTYNELCEAEIDTEFGKNSFFLNPVKTSDFYALKIFPVMYGTIGGISVSARLEALDDSHRAIQGLYAAGYDANGCLGAPVSDYTMGTPGLTFGFALNSGRIAGESAAEYAKEKNA